ncbi:MAG: spore coat protein GerQ [Bacillaceae bacterium]|nr:spore coat protein GerQ [Bacillaceae bacterium]
MYQQQWDNQPGMDGHTHMQHQQPTMDQMMQQPMMDQHKMQQPMMDHHMMQQPMMQQPMMQQPMMQQPMMQQPMMQQPMMQQPMMQQPMMPPLFYAPQPHLQQQFPQIPGMLPMEMSYIENILRLNRGKRVRVYMTFENNPEWPSRVFTGIVREAGRDHIVISDPQTGMWYLLLMVNLDYVEFDEEIEYDYPFGQAPLAAYPPREED